jgi:hypothetical protein
MIDKNTIIPVGDVEWNTFVCLITGSPSILIPDLDGLTCGGFEYLSLRVEKTIEIPTIFYERSKLLSQAVDELTWGQIQFRVDIMNYTRQRLWSRIR